MISVHRFQGFPLEDLRTDGQGIFEMFALFPVSLGNRLHRFLRDEDGERGFGVELIV